jgi:flagellar assembly protein FliH
MMSLSRILKSRETSLVDIKVIEIATVSFEQSTDIPQDTAGGTPAELIGNTTYQELHEQFESRLEEYKQALLEEHRQAQAHLLEDVQKQREQARAEGFAEGYKDGTQKGIEIGRKEYESLIIQAQNVLKSIQKEREQYLSDNESVLIELAFAVAERILQDQIEKNPEYIIPIAKAALQEVQDIQQVEVRVHPNDYEAVFNAKKTLLTTLPGQNELLIIPDLAVEYGGCVIHTAFGSIDARIDSQLQEIKRGLQSVCKGMGT